MRLSNTIRDAFVRAALGDVPRTDFDEMISKVACADAANQLPPKVRVIYNDKALRHFVATDRRRIGGIYVQVPTGGDYKASAEASAEVTRLAAAREAQDKLHSELRLKLRGCAYACSTRKALVDMLPEFEKYMPADEVAACRTLPVVANVVADFVKAGWPDAKKGKEPKNG